jgi:hypothetical protein
MRGLSLGRALAPAHLALALVAVVYVPIALGRPADAFWSPDQGGKLLQIWALLEGRPDLSINYPGRWLDPALEFRPFYLSYVRHDTIQLPWPMAWALPAALLYAVLGGPGLVVLPVAGGLLAAWSAGRLAERIVPGSGWPAVLMAGLATPLLPFSTLFWEHAPTAGLFTAGLTLLPLSGQAGHRAALVLAGFCFGSAMAWRNETAVYALIALAAWWVLRGVGRGRGLLWLLAGLLPVVLVATTYQGAETFLPARTAPFGAETANPYQRTLWRSLALPADFLVGSGSGLGLPESLRWAPAAGLVLLIAALWSDRLRPRLLQPLGLGLVGVATVWLLASPLPRSVHGFLLVSPFISVVLLRPRALCKSQTAKLLLTVAILAVVIYVGATAILHPRGLLAGAIEWGPRYLLPIYPPLAALASASLRQLPDFLLPPAGWLVGALILLALASQVAGLASIDLALQEAAQSGRLIASIPGDPMVFRREARLLLTPGLTQSQTVFCARRPGALKRWSELASRAHLDSFWYVDFGPIDRGWFLPGATPPPILEVLSARPLRAFRYPTAALAASLSEEGVARDACAFTVFRR